MRFRELVTGAARRRRERAARPRAVGRHAAAAPRRGRARTRARCRGATSSGATRRSPPAGVRFLASAGLPLPPGAPRGEAYRRPPDLDDWVVLLEDWVLRCLDGQAAPAAAARREAVAAALRDLGYQLTRTGIRRAASDVDRLLTGSAAKPLALVEVLGAEAEARGTDLRALVLCDAELAGARAGRRAARRPRPGRRHGARGGRARWPTTPARRSLRPLLVSGRGLRCAEEDARRCWRARGALAEAEGRRRRRRGWAAGRPRAGSSSCAAPATGAPRRWVGLATARFEAGATRALIGTRAFLGEGWNAPCVNCLVDLTSAATGVSVRQMRGRSLRLDPADPEKVASNWDVVCVAPRHAQGDADYERFVRKHRHLHAPADDGTLEAGVGHVHPDLSPFAPAAGRALRRDRAGDGAGRPTATRPARAGGSALRTRGTRSRRSCCTRARPAARRRPRPPTAPPPLALGSARCSAPARARRSPPPAARSPRRSHSPACCPRPASPAPRCARARRTLGSPRRRAARPRRARGVRRVRRARRAARGGGGVAGVRAARVGLPALPAARRDAGGGGPRHRGARRAARPGRAPALPRLAPRRPAGPVGRPRSLRVAGGSRAPLATAWHAVPDDLGRRKERAEALAPPGGAGSARRSSASPSATGRPGRARRGRGAGVELRHAGRAVWQ